MVRPQTEDRKPPVDERYRMFLRIVAVVLGYGLYLLLQRDELAAGVLAGSGVIALGWSVVDRLTLWRRDRSEMMSVATTLLGGGLVAIGVVLYLT
jgi:hypothetical protein